ncbi:MAG: AraC family transcriptional regulator [Burkholderiales bacterium]|nr:MAG: AraC family transcriptional regulator [Burkholderiales bacterium]
MLERADHPDFDIRLKGVRTALVTPHRHEYFQIQVGLDGQSNQAIGGAVRPFGPRYLSFVLPYRVHMVPHPVGSNYCIINFQQKFLWPALEVDPLDLDDTPMARCPDLAPFLFQEYIDFEFNEADFARIRSWIDEMQILNQDRSFGALTGIRGILQQIIGLACVRKQAELLHCSVQHGGKTSQRDALQRVVRYVKDNLDKEISLTEAAAAAFLSPNYLTHLLKKETGRTFTDLVTDRRMERAKELLSTSNIRVREVAYQCGFNDEAYFNRRFRQQFQQTPKQFREDVIAQVAA